MPFDGVLTHFMAEELNSRLSGGRIGKIYQISRDTIILQIRAGGENYRLLISSNASSPRIHLTEKQYETPDNPPVFCMVLESTVRSKDPTEAAVLSVHHNGGRSY